MADPLAWRKLLSVSGSPIGNEPPVVGALLDSSLDLIARLFKVERDSVVLLKAEPNGSSDRADESIDSRFEPSNSSSSEEPGAGEDAGKGAVSGLNYRRLVRSGAIPSGPFSTRDIMVSGKRWGKLFVVDALRDRVFDKADRVVLKSAAHHLGLCLENRLLHAQTQTLANTDGLTELFNYRYLHERLDSEINRAERFGSPLSLLMVDVDGFKEFNDSYGHPAGDTVLRKIAHLLRNSVRGFDVVCRYGGDEFAVILPETPLAQAVTVAERIEGQVAEDHAILPAGARPIAITLSIGCATYPEHGGGRGPLIAAADRALYAAKRMPSRPRVSILSGGSRSEDVIGGTP